MKHKLIFALVTAVTMISVLASGCKSEPDCKDPQTWSTEAGVQACAINGGK